VKAQPRKPPSVWRCWVTKNRRFLKLQPGITDHLAVCAFKRAMIGCLVLSCAGFAQGQEDRSTDLRAHPIPTAARVRRFRLFNWPRRGNSDADRANSEVPTPSSSIANQICQSPAGLTAPVLTYSPSGDPASASLNNFASTEAEPVQPGMGSGDSQA